MKKILITGGAGFIGSHLANELIKRGYTVRVLDNLSEQVHGKNAKIPAELDERVEFILGDVRNTEDWRKALSGMDVVVHLAAETAIQSVAVELTPERYFSSPSRLPPMPPLVFALFTAALIYAAS